MTGDIHLTDSPRDAYRWRVFENLARAAESEKAAAIAILGDVFDRKDGHKSALVNRCVDEVAALADRWPVHILTGNHDYIDPAQPFLRFLDRVPNVRWYVGKPQRVEIAGVPVFVIPHTHSATEDFADIEVPEDVELVMMHQTVCGADVGGWTMDHGLDPEAVAPTIGRTIVSGDVHVPQSVGPITYIGAPHPINFGDEWACRFLVYKSTGRLRLKAVPVPSIRKRVVVLDGSSDELPTDLREGDQIKVQVALRREEFGEFDAIRASVAEECAARGVDLRGTQIDEQVHVKAGTKVEPQHAETLEALIRRWGKATKMPEHRMEFGITLAREAQP